MSNIEARCCPVWARRVITTANSVPLTDLKAHIRAEAKSLPDLLRADGSGQRERETLLSLRMKCARVLEAMRLGPFDKLPVLKPKKLRKLLATEAAELPVVLDTAGELDRARKIYRIKVLCHRQLALLLLVLALLLGVCPLCEFFMQMPLMDLVEVAYQENHLRAELPQG